jgi:hypothetical protein
MGVDAANPGRFSGRALAVLLVVVLGIAGGAAADLTIHYPKQALAVWLPIVCLLPIFVRVIQRKFDPFEPIQILALTFFILYGIRPAAELLSGFYYFDNQYTRSGFTGAAAVSLVGVLSIYAGYALYLGRSAARRAPQVPDRWDPERSVRFGIYVMIACVLLTLAFGAQVGFNTLFHFYLGRTQTSYETFLAVSGYVGLGPDLTIPAAIIFVFAFARLRTFKTFILLAINLAGAIFVTVPGGNRTYVLALVLPLIVFPYLRVQKRPTAATTLVVLLIGILGLNVLLATRTATSGRQSIPSAALSAVTHIPSQLKKFATGVDLAEFSVLELEYQAYNNRYDPLQFEPGQTVLATVAYPLPSSLIGGHKNKPPAAGQAVVNRLFPNTSGQRASFNPALFGDFYADSSWFSIVIYDLLLGIAIRFMWEYFLLHSRSEGMQILFAAALPMLVILVRNSVTDTIARSLFLVGPLLWCLLVCSRPKMRRFAGWRVKPGRGDRPFPPPMIGRAPQPEPVVASSDPAIPA